MALLRDKDYKDIGLEIEFKLSASEFYNPSGGEWVSANVILRFGKDFPEIKINRDGQEVPEIENFIEDLHKIAKDKISRINFEPIEPDYEVIITQSGRGKYEKENLYEVVLIIDAQGSRGGAYYGTGPAIRMYATREEIDNFAVKLNTELYKIKKEYNPL